MSKPSYNLLPEKQSLPTHTRQIKGVCKSDLVLLMVSLIVNHRAILIYFQLLDHVGNSDLETQNTILSRVLPVLKGYKKVILGDQKFCSVDLAKWLQQQEKTYFCLRLKRNCYLKVEKEVWMQLQTVGLQPGAPHLILYKMDLTKVMFYNLFLKSNRISFI